MGTGTISGLELGADHVIRSYRSGCRVAGNIAPIDILHDMRGVPEIHHHPPPVAAGLRRNRATQNGRDIFALAVLDGMRIWKTILPAWRVQDAFPQL